MVVKDSDIQINYSDKDVLIKGTRNKNDGLYDIPIRNTTTIQPDNYLLPPIIGPISTKQITPKETKQSSTHSTKATTSQQLQHFQINNISQKDFNHIIQPVINENIKNLQSVNIISPSLNVQLSSCCLLFPCKIYLA